MKLALDSYAYSLARIRWDVFGTLTFRSVPSPKRAFGRAWAHMHQAADIVERPYSQLLIALRAELGEKGGRFHFHYLLGGTWTRNAITLAHQLEHRWFGMFGQGAIAKCRTAGYLSCACFPAVVALGILESVKHLTRKY